jgi:hypothetical protein
VSEWYTIEEADALLPEVAERMARLSALQGEMRQVLEWFEERHLQVKGAAPPLVDFPARYRGREVLLCWTEGEERIGWYHLPDAGFAGRRPIEELTG